MKEVHGASTVKNTSLKSARAILSTVVNEYSGNRDSIFSNEASEKTSEKSSLKSERRIVHKRASRKEPLLSINLSVGSKKSDGEENEDKMCPPSRKLRPAAELYSYKKAS